MALPSQTYEQARRNARLHVQVELDRIDQEIIEDNEEFFVSGKVVRIFWGRRICRTGQFVEFNVAVKVSSEDYFSGIIWLQGQDLLGKKYMEVYLNGKPPKCHVALYQYELIETPTENPILPSPPHQWWDTPVEMGQRWIYRVKYWLRWKIWLP